ncbi:hypothetical protein MRX96_006342 [Rhipicephalus microplus]
MPYSLFHDQLLLRTLRWNEIKNMYLLRTALRRDLQINSLLDLDRMDFTTFYHSFRFQKAHLEDLMEALLIAEEVVSAQQVRVSGREALCMMLWHLAYPNRLCELELFFMRHSSVISSVVSKGLAHIYYYFRHLLADLTLHKWLNLQSLELFSQPNQDRMRRKRMSHRMKPWKSGPYLKKSSWEKQEKRRSTLLYL